MKYIMNEKQKLSDWMKCMLFIGTDTTISTELETEQKRKINNRTITKIKK